MKMRMLETLDDSDYTKMFSGTPTALFSEIFVSSDIFYSKVGRACSEYYLNHSGNKNLSQFYEILYEKKSTTVNPENIIGKTIRSKFIDKWNKIYNLLDSQTYNVLDNYSDTENVLRYNNETVTNRTDDTVGVKIATDITTTNSTETENNIYGFNSSTSVGDTSGNASGTTNVKGSKTGNTEDTTATKQVDGSKDTTEDYTKTKSGRDKSASELISEEIDFRNYRIFFNIVYADIDSIATMPLYN